MFREEATSALPGFPVGPQSWSNWNLEVLAIFKYTLKIDLKRPTFYAYYSLMMV